MLQRREFIRRAAIAATLLGVPVARAEQVLCDQPPPLPSRDLLSTNPSRYWTELRKQWLLAPDHINLNCGSVGCTPLPVLRAMIDHILSAEQFSEVPYPWFGYDENTRLHELRVALATTHLPLRAVSEALSVDSLCHSAATLAQALERWWGISAPRIAVCGLNPHAGEGGHLGDEEIRIITPAIERMRARGIRASGPLPADTAFVPRVLENFDAVLAMYHDQGLPVIKHVGFGNAVNMTLGLPILRTSVDHGTALKLARSGQADSGSLSAAVALAIDLADHADS